MIQLLIDTDVGGDVDDAFAIALAALSNRINLIAITTSTGNTINRVKIASKLVKTLNKNPEIVAGIGNFHTIKNQDHTTTNRQNNATELILRLSHKYPNNLIIAGIAPLTNIAHALKKDSTLPKRIKKLVVLGGFMNQPKINGKQQQVPLGFEYNLCTDLKALDLILKAKFNFFLLLGDYTFIKKAQWTKQELKRLYANNQPIILKLIAMKKIWDKTLEKKIRSAHLPKQLVKHWLNDIILIEYLINPDFFEIKKVKINFEIKNNKYPLLKKVQDGYPINIIKPVKYRNLKKDILDQLINKV